jgi:hypothetical protein
MIFKKFRIITSQNYSIDPSAQALVDSVAGDFNIPSTAADIYAAAESAYNRDPKNFETLFQNMIQRTRDEVNAANEVASRMGITPQDAYDIIKDVMFKDFDPGEVSKVLLEAFKLSKNLGITGKTVLTYLERLLSKRASDLQQALNTFKEHVDLITNISSDAKITGSEVFKIFEQAIVTNNWKSVNAMVAMIPLLKMDWKTFGTLDPSSISKLLNGVQKASQVNLPQSDVEKMLDDVFDSFNLVKRAFLPILEKRRKLLFDMQRERNDRQKWDYLTNPNKFIDMYKNYDNIFGNYQQIKTFEFGSPLAPTSQAPQASLLEKKSNVHKKIRIVVAIDPSADLTLNSANAAYNQELRDINSLHSEITRLTHSTERSKKKLDQFFDQQYISVGAAKEGPAPSIVVSFLDLSNVYPEFHKIKREVGELEAKIRTVKTKVGAFTSNPDLPAVMQTAANNIMNDLDQKEDLIQDKQQTILKFEKLMKIAPLIKDYDSKITKYNSAKAQVDEDPAVTDVTIKQYDPITGSLIDKNFNKFNWVAQTHALGIQIGAVMEAMERSFRAGPDPNDKASADRILNALNEFLANNRKWRDKIQGVGSAAQMRK